MSKIYPPIEIIKKSKQPPTDGELSLLMFLEKEYDNDAEVYFQPYFNGDRPDVVIIHKTKGVIIIEVKDWDLKHYHINENNNWILNKNKAKLKSPFYQVFGYKKNMFDIHINGLLEKKIRNNNFYRVISCFVYFHCENKDSLRSFYRHNIDYYNDEIKINRNKFTEKNIAFESYEKKDNWLAGKRKKFERDLNVNSLTKDQFKKIKFPFIKENSIYPISVYESFIRYLQPPFHALNDGKVINYHRKQAELTLSLENDRKKVKGVAGSGKTTVLAKRAVNAHKRHGERVLILTYNLTLRMYVKDKINEVREDFSWGFFDIINYHKFLNQTFNSVGMLFDIPENIKNHDDARNQFIDKNYYSNENVFASIDIKNKYQTILVDEIQDYKPEWIKIIRKYFLQDNGEMILFGDEKQNIYEREVDDDKTSKIVQGFGRWKNLTKNFRNKEDSHILSLAKDFQDTFFSGRYSSDYDESFQRPLQGIGLNKCLKYQSNDVLTVVKYIYLLVKKENIHPNDIVILSSGISIIREIDFLIRKNLDFNERTLTTFESKEALGSKEFSRNILKIRANKKYGFNLNSGVVKLSTIHSFKGYEAPTVFLIIDERDSAELIYVGITRAKINLVVFVQEGSKYESFFTERLEVVDIESNGT